MDKNKLQSVFPVAIVLLIAIILRFYQLGVVPISIYWDETAFGYNAFSILKTGRDEYGKLFPLLLQSFDDYKLAGYAYLSIPFIWLFGLSELSLRFASAFFGTLTVLTTYLFVKVLVSINKKEVQKAYTFLPITSALFLAISPWHLQFSRAGYEANSGLFFIVTGAWLFLRGIKSSKYIYFSMVSFGLSLYMYRAAYVFVPILILGMIIIFRKSFSIKTYIAAFLYFY